MTNRFSLIVMALLAIILLGVGALSAHPVVGVGVAALALVLGVRHGEPGSAVHVLQSRFMLVCMALVAVIVVLVGHALGRAVLGLGAGAMLPLIGMSQAWQDSDVVRQLIAWGILDGAGGLKKRILVKTADYAIVSPATTAGDPSGTIFTNRGAAGAVVFTLPAPVAALAGVWYEFLGHADQTFSLATATADTLVVVNDVAADSLAVSTAGQKIGAHMRAVCDGTSWFAYGDSVGGTFTVAT